MFQTEPIHALQSLASEGMTAFMLAVTTLGYAWILIPMLLVIAFGVDFRRGFVLVLTVAWTGVLINVLKTAFALPRPESVDSTLLQPGDDDPEIIPFERMGAPGFWEPLPTEVVSYYRGLGDVSYGLPSGHVGITTVMWGAIAMLFRKRWLWALAFTLVVLMPLSRMYLGRHFLADVLGGFVVGLLVLGVAYSAAIRPLSEPGHSPVLQRAIQRLTLPPGSLRTFLYLLLPLLVALVPGAELDSVLRLMGLHAGLWLLTRGGLPVGGGSLGARAARVILAFALYLITGRVLTTALEAVLGESEILEAVIRAVSAFVLVWGTTVICYRIGLYERGEPGVGLLEPLR